MILPLKHDPIGTIPNYFNKPIKCSKCTTSRQFPTTTHPNYQFLSSNLKKIYLKAFLFHLSENAKKSNYSRMERKVYESYFKFALDNQLNPPLPNVFGPIHKHLTNINDPKVPALRNILLEEVRIAFLQSSIEVGEFCFKSLSSKGCLHEFFDQSSIRTMIKSLNSKYDPLKISIFPEEESLEEFNRIHKILRSYGELELDEPESSPIESIPALVNIVNGVEIVAAETIENNSETALQRDARRARNYKIWYYRVVSSYNSTLTSLKQASLEACLSNLLVLSPCFFLIHLVEPIKLLEITLQSRSGERRKDLSSTIDFCISGALDNVTPLDFLSYISGSNSSHVVKSKPKITITLTLAPTPPSPSLEHSSDKESDASSMYSSDEDVPPTLYRRSTPYVHSPTVLKPHRDDLAEKSSRAKKRSDGGPSSISRFADMVLKGLKSGAVVSFGFLSTVLRVGFNFVSTVLRGSYNFVTSDLVNRSIETSVLNLILCSASIIDLIWSSFIWIENSLIKTIVYILFLPYRMLRSIETIIRSINFRKEGVEGLEEEDLELDPSLTLREEVDSVRKRKVHVPLTRKMRRVGMVRKEVPREGEEIQSSTFLSSIISTLLDALTYITLGILSLGTEKPSTSTSSSSNGSNSNSNPSGGSEVTKNLVGDTSSIILPILTMDEIKSGDYDNMPGLQDASESESESDSDDD